MGVEATDTGRDRQDLLPLSFCLYLFNVPVDATCELASHQRVFPHLSCLSVVPLISLPVLSLFPHFKKTHAYPQVERYAKTFWEKGSTAFAAADWERHVKSVEKGERKIEEITRYTYFECRADVMQSCVLTMDLPKKCIP